MVTNPLAVSVGIAKWDPCDGRGLMTVGAALPVPAGQVTARMCALRELARVLKPDGQAFIADYTATRSYARELRAARLQVHGPRSAVLQARGLMSLVSAVKR